MFNIKKTKLGTSNAFTLISTSIDTKEKR